jgi:hypothetical protein
MLSIIEINTKNRTTIPVMKSILDFCMFLGSLILSLIGNHYAIPKKE